MNGYIDIKILLISIIFIIMEPNYRNYIHHNTLNIEKLKKNILQKQFYSQNSDFQPL